MKSSLTALTLAAALALAGTAQAQTTASPAPGTTAPNPASPTGAPPAAPTATPGASANQAIRTQPDDAAQPAHGANSFTHGQAVGRLHKNGYTQVKGLKKDSNGVWRGTAMKDGAQVSVWLDYKGNVGQQ
jgi:hypothetical protein